jgi:hypothetical protein
VNRILGILGPVPSGGDPTLMGFCVFVVSLLGFLSLPLQIRKIDSIKSQWPKIAFLVVILSCLLLVGLLMLSRGLNHRF